MKKTWLFFVGAFFHCSPLNFSQNSSHKIHPASKKIQKKKMNIYEHEHRTTTEKVPRVNIVPSKQCFAFFFGRIKEWKADDAKVKQKLLMFTVASGHLFSDCCC